MKRYLPVAIAAALFLFTGCKSKNEPKPSGSDSYFPVTSGSSWTYNEDVNTTTGTTTITLTGATATFNNKTYYIANTVSDKAGTGTSYFYAGNHAYATRNLNGADGALELQMGYDNEAAGYSWITQPTDDGLFEGFAARTVNTIKEINLTKTVNGKTYANVIHTQVDFQLGDAFESNAVYDIYLAKGIGLIQMDTHAYGILIGSRTITNYSIK